MWDPKWIPDLGYWIVDFGWKKKKLSRISNMPSDLKKLGKTLGFQARKLKPKTSTRVGRYDESPFINVSRLMFMIISVNTKQYLELQLVSYKHFIKFNNYP